MRCFFCRRTEDIVHINDLMIGYNGIYICDECQNERRNLNTQIQSLKEITYDIYKLSMHYELDCPTPRGISMLDIFYAMAE